MATITVITTADSNTGSGQGGAMYLYGYDQEKVIVDNSTIINNSNSNSDPKEDIFPGQAGYIQAAIDERVPGIDLIVNSGVKASLIGNFTDGYIYPSAILDSHAVGNFCFLGENSGNI